MSDNGTWNNAYHMEYAAYGIEVMCNLFFIYNPTSNLLWWLKYKYFYEDFEVKIRPKLMMTEELNLRPVKQGVFT